MTGFWLIDEDGREVHINGDPDMSEEKLENLLALFEAAYRTMLEREFPAAEELDF